MVCKCSLVERLDLLPMAVLLMIGGKLPARPAKSAHFVGHLPQDYPDDFWRGYLTGKEAESSFKHMTTHYHCMLDFVQHWHISSESFASWPGRALILESDLERDVTPLGRASTKGLFVNSSVHVFHNARHLSFVTHTQEFTETVIRFLACCSKPSQ